VAQLTIGRIVKPHGIRGEVLVDVRTDEPGARFAAGSVLATDPAGAGPLTVEYARGHAQAGRQRLIVAFAEITDRTAAEDARGIALLVEGGELADPDDPDEFLDHHLVGLTVVGADGVEIGEVTRVDHMPSADLLTVRRPDGKEALVPFVKAIVPEVDLAAGRIVVTPPEGLFDL
jgi:16S rRNA processing protein RimM